MFGKAARSPKEQMLMNWPERVWIYSPVRVAFLRLHARRWKRLVGPIAGGHALEIGCGLGKGAQILIREMGFSQVTAFDLEETLIVRAKRGLPGDLSHRVSFFVGDSQDLPFPTALFDSVVNYGIIHHVLDWRRCISEIARVLKPGGIFYFEEIYPALYANFLLGPLLRHPTEDRFHAHEFLAELFANGLKLIEGVRTKSRFGIVGAARKAIFPQDRLPTVLRRANISSNT